MATRSYTEPEEAAPGRRVTTDQRYVVGRHRPQNKKKNKQNNNNNNDKSDNNNNFKALASSADP